MKKKIKSKIEEVETKMKSMESFHLYYLRQDYKDLKIIKKTLTDLLN